MTRLGAALALVHLLCCAGAHAQSVKPVTADTKAKVTFTEVAFPLEHSLGVDAPFTRAGTFTARAYFDKNGTGAVKLTHPKLERSPASKDDEAAFARLLADNWLYRVRVPGQALHPERAAQAGSYAASFLPARCLAGAGFQEAWALHTDAAGNLVALDYAPPGGTCPQQQQTHEGGAAARVPGGLLFRTVSVAFRTARDAPTLASTPSFDIGAAVSGADEAAAQQNPLGGGANETAKERTFMQKYGMFIWVLGIQVMLHMFRGSADEPPRAGGQRPGGGAPGSGASAAPAARKAD